MTKQKWKLSPYYWANFWFFLASGAVVEVCLLWMMCNWTLSNEDLLWIPVFFMPSAALVCLCCALNQWRFMMTMQLDDGVICSYLFGRLCCTVLTDQPVYYALLKFDEHYSIVKPYIAISNHPFRIEPRDHSFFRLHSNRFIDYYDRSSTILFPYDENTKDLFPTDLWHQIGDIRSR